jgi:hypothetical protein
MEVEYFKMKHKVLKNSLHVQIWSDFEKVSLKKSGKTWFFVKMGEKKILLNKYQSYPGKTKITKVNFPLQEPEQKMFVLGLPLRKICPRNQWALLKINPCSPQSSIRLCSMLMLLIISIQMKSGIFYWFWTMASSNLLDFLYFDSTQFLKFTTFLFYDSWSVRRKI